MIRGVETRVTPDTRLENLQIRDFLHHSLYYPACGLDGDPVRYLASLVHSFVYVDYGLEHNEVWAALHDDRQGFSGYRVLDCRDVTEDELTPHGWQPIQPGSADGNPMNFREYIKKPFAIWSVHERKSDYDEKHGPDRFSLLYVCADGAAASQALYHGNRCAPEVLAIIQPGTSFGCNYTDFCDPNQILGRSVFQNRYGIPRYLLYGGMGCDYREICWPVYSRLIRYWQVVDGGELGLWERITNKD